MTISINDSVPEALPEKPDIEKKLLALEAGETGADGENYRAAVRAYQNYLVPFVRDARGAARIFKIHGLYEVESVPVFLSEEIYLLFRDDYLENHDHLDELAARSETLTLRALSGEELFAMIPPISLGGVFILSAAKERFLFNFNLAEVFRDCFQEVWTDPDLRIEPAAGAAPEFEGDRSASVRNSAQWKIEKSRTLRRLFETGEWIVLISQPTKNKLLKGEFTRDDFDLDRHGDGRIFIFSDPAAVEEYRRATGQAAEKLYNIRVDGRRIFGAELAAYSGILIDSYSTGAARIGAADFDRLNELWAAFEVEEKLREIVIAREKSANFSELTELFTGIREYINFILPADKRLREAAEARPDVVFERIRDASGEKPFPVFTSEDCFEAFRLRSFETAGSDESDLVEPFFIDGPTLFQKICLLNAPGIVFNPEGPVRPLVFEPNFALKTYCA